MRRLSPILRATDVVLSFYTIDGITGIRHLMTATLNGAARIVNQGPFAAERFFELVERYKVTFTGTSGSMVKQLLNHPRIDSADLSSFKQYCVGFAKIPLDLIEKMNEKLPNGKCCQSYGMSELVGPVAINLRLSKNDCVGQLISGAEVKILDENGQRLGVGEIGEVCIRQPFRFSGYIGDDEEKGSYFDDEGFYATGDIGYFDENCDLFLVDRKKAIFKTSGYHVTPVEIETFLDKIDGVKQSCIVPIPDKLCDNLPAAVIVKEQNAICTEQSIHEAVLSKFSHDNHNQVKKC